LIDGISQIREGCGAKRSTKKAKAK